MTSQARAGSRLIVALDVPSAEQAVLLAQKVEAHVGGYKVGLELLMGPGPAVVPVVAELGKPVFVDAKLHDIPNTVRAAARQLGRMGARWVSAHGSGGSPVLEAAVEGLLQGSSGSEAGILAITVLTSHDSASLAAVGVTGSPGRQVSRLSRLAEASGVEGVVCSVRELGDVAQAAPSLMRVTPGIRPAGTPSHDQARTATPETAIARGADLIVVGRPITAAADPEQAAAELAESLTAATGARLVESPEADVGRDQ